MVAHNAVGAVDRAVRIDKRVRHHNGNRQCILGRVQGNTGLLAAVYRHVLEQTDVEILPDGAALGGLCHRRFDFSGNIGFFHGQHNVHTCAVGNLHQFIGGNVAAVHQHGKQFGFVGQQGGGRYSALRLDIHFHLAAADCNILAGGTLRLGGDNHIGLFNSAGIVALGGDGQCVYTVGGGGVARHSVGVCGNFFIAQQDFLHRLGLFRTVGGKTLAQHNCCALDGLRLDGKRTLGKRHIVVRVCASISGAGDVILAGIFALGACQRDTCQRFTVQDTTDFVSQFGVVFLIYLRLVVRGDGGGALGNGEFSSSGVGIQRVVAVGDGCRDGVSACLGGRCDAGVLGAIVGCAGVGQRDGWGILAHNTVCRNDGRGNGLAVSAAVGLNAHSDLLGGDGGGGLGLISAFSQHIVGNGIAAQRQIGNPDFLLTDVSLFKHTLSRNGQLVIFQNTVKFGVAAIQHCIGRAVIDFVFCRNAGNGNLLGGDIASRMEAALLQEVILRGLPHQGHCGSDVLAAAHTGIVKAGGDGVVCVSGQSHVVEGHAGNVRVFRAIIRLGRSRYPGDRQRLLPNADRHAGGCGIVVVCIANHPIPHGICSGIGAGRDVRAVCAVLGQAVLHGATAGHAARGNERLRLAGIGQVFLRRGSVEGGGSLVHLDGHSSGHSRVFLVARSRSECPLSLIVAGFVGLGTRIRPLEGAFDRIAVVFHRASNGADAQDLAKGDWRCGDFAVQHGNDLVLRDDFNGQEHVLIVVRGDLDAYGSDGTFGLRFDSRDSQLELIV